jgi:EmrB/QacA subfamily drug resistance transporter
VDDAAIHDRRWFILGVLCLSLLLIVLDNSIVNVALPTLQRELNASTSELQWVVDAYTLVFAGLLLTAGSIGDKFGRKGALQFGLTVMGLGALASSFAGSANQLVFTRAFMGIGAAFIMPSTLSILTNSFTNPRERARAIAVWAAFAGAGAALGPLTGGLLLKHFYWGSIFLVNVPVIVTALITGAFILPTSRDVNAPRLDVPGALLSIAGLVTLVWAIIEAGSQGFTDAAVLEAFFIAAVLLAAFMVREWRTDHPMLDVNFFRNPRFSAASAAVTLTFFAMFGALFLLTQYLQFVLNYDPLETGIRLLPMAITMMIVAPNSARLVERFGTKVVVGTGLLITSTGLLLCTNLTADSAYGPVAGCLVWFAIGMGLTMAPATESIMGSLPRAKAGVGSAVNDTTRQIGGALGVAVLGSILAAKYSSGVEAFFAGSHAPASVVSAASDQLAVALSLGGSTSGLADAAKSSFVEGMHAGLVVGALVAAVGAVIVFAFLPARAPDDVTEVAPVLPEPVAETGAAEALTT